MGIRSVIALLFAPTLCLAQDTKAIDPALNDPRLDVKIMTALTEAELKDARQLADKIKNLAPDSPARKKVPNLLALLQHLEDACLDPLYPAKIRAALAVAEDWFQKSYKPPPTKAGRGEHMEYRRLKEALVNALARVILEKKFGIVWLPAGFPDWWRLSAIKGFEGLRPLLPGVEN
jgi:hypothetical protein